METSSDDELPPNLSPPLTILEVGVFFVGPKDEFFVVRYEFDSFSGEKSSHTIGLDFGQARA